MPFAQTLRNLREQSGLTQEQLAASLGISKSAVSMYEQGNRQPDFETLEAIADHFNVDMNLLLGRKAGDAADARLLSWGTPLLRAYAAAIRPTQEAACAVLGLKHVRPGKPPATASAKVEMLVFNYPAAAGQPLYAEDDYERIPFDPSDVPAGADFGIRIRGDSMYPTIEDGAIVFVHKQFNLEPREIGIFMINDEAVCKRFGRKGSGVYLQSDNPKYAEMPIRDFSHFYVVGKVLGYR